ncbi:MAG: sialidase [Acidobacteriia bacterium]|nr:sialidase [Terriglobia bacterium]
MRNPLLLVALAAAAAGTASPALPPPQFDSATISGLGARNIGSAAMSGRISAVTGVVVGGKVTLFVGAASGGVWRSLDFGTTFKPVFDREPVQSIGAIAVDPGDPKVVWVGTGESWTRNSVSLGDGIYKSTDGGETWTRMGLEASERIAAVAVDPRHGDTVYACVPGKLWSDSTDRGLYKTTDGGKTWSLALRGSNPSTGCSSLALDPASPDTLYAAMWDFRRKGWTFRSGGESPSAPSGSGLYKSTDGGTSWTEISGSASRGFPAKPFGRIAVSVAPSDPKIVYAVVECAAAGLYRSDDGGATWSARDRSQNVVWRPFYFANLIVDPKNPDKVFKPDLGLVVSLDGGKTFAASGGGMHSDWHVAWIDPTNPSHVVAGTDGGLGISYDGGNRWSMAMNLPVSQFYHVSVDDQDPYRVYGGLQDNSAWVGDSSYPGGVSNSRWENLNGGDGFFMFPDPADSDYVYAESQGGEIGRIRRSTHESRPIQPTAGYGEKLRWNWNTPIHLSPNDKGTLYIGAQFLFRTRDHGANWERISHDLTTDDPAKQKQEESGGVTVDNSAAETHTTIYTISESPRDRGVIWVGTDDGNVQLTRDGGGHWSNQAPRIEGLPPGSWVSWIEASRHDSATAYAAIDRHTFGDMTPYAYVTRDFGLTWRRIVSPEQGVRGYVHVIREDPVSPALLFLGTEFGLYVSNDGGGHWAAFKGGGFPTVAVRDLTVDERDADLVIATHGRGIWIVDDITPLRALTPGTLEKDAAFVDARPVQQRVQASGGWSDGDATFVGESAPTSAEITYYLRTRHLFGPIRLEILDHDGKVVAAPAASTHRGLNRVTWDMRVKPPRVPPAAQVANTATRGPRVVPGTYTVRLSKGAEVLETPLKIGLDRRATFDQDDRKANFDAAMRVHALFGRMSDLNDRIVAVRDGAAGRARPLPKDDGLRRSLESLSGAADALRRKIVATKEGGAITGEERLREHVESVYGALLSYEGRPAAYLIDRTAALERELKDVERAFDELSVKDLSSMNDALKARGLTPIVVPQAER